MAVVFPAPLGPRSPRTVAGGTPRSMPASASTLPYRLASPSTTIAGSLMEPAILQTPSTAAERCGDALLTALEVAERGPIQAQAPVPDVLVRVRQQLELGGAARNGLGHHRRELGRRLPRLPDDPELSERQQRLGVPAANGVRGQLASEQRPRRDRLQRPGSATRSACRGRAARVRRPTGGRKCRIARTTAYAMAANTRNPRIRCQIDGSPAPCCSNARRAEPSRRLSRNSRTRSGSMPSRSTSQKIGRAAWESTQAKNVATALAAGVNHIPIRSKTPPSMLNTTAAAIAATSAPVARRARRIHAARTRSSSSPAPPEVHTVLALLASAATKNTGTNSRSGARHSLVAPAAINTSRPSARANHPTSAWIGARQSRSPSVTSRNATRRAHHDREHGPVEVAVSEPDPGQHGEHGGDDRDVRRCSEPAGQQHAPHVDRHERHGERHHADLQPARLGQDQPHGQGEDAGLGERGEPACAQLPRLGAQDLARRHHADAPEPITTPPPGRPPAARGGSRHTPVVGAPPSRATAPRPDAARPRSRWSAGPGAVRPP